MKQKALKRIRQAALAMVIITVVLAFTGVGSSHIIR